MTPAWFAHRCSHGIRLHLKYFQNYDVTLRTMSSAVPEKMDPQPGQNRFDIFTRFELELEGAFKLFFYNPDLMLSPGTWLFSTLKERLTGRKFTPPNLSKAVGHFRAQCYAYSGVPICSSDVAEAARNVCGQWMDVAVWRNYDHWFPCYITCDRTFGLLLGICSFMNWNWNIKKEGKVVEHGCAFGGQLKGLERQTVSAKDGWKSTQLLKSCS